MKSLEELKTSISEAFFARPPIEIEFSPRPPLLYNQATDLASIKKNILEAIEKEPNSLSIEVVQTITGYLGWVGYTYYTTADLAKSMNFIWTESVVLERDIRDKAWVKLLDYVDRDPNYGMVCAFIEERLHNPLNTLVIADMGNDLGKGVFLSMNAKPLPAGTVIGLYSGKILGKDPNIRDTDPYALRLPSEACENSFLSTIYNIESTVISPILYGNICRFMQDLPAEEELEEVENISEKQKNKIATCNVAQMIGTCYGFPIVYLVTAREIRPGEQLGSPYSWSWEHWNKRRTVCDKNGEILGNFLDGKTISITGSQITTVEDAPRVDDELARKALAFTPSFDEFNFQKRFKENVNHCLGQYLTRFKLDSLCGRYILKLKDAFNNAVSSGDKFKILSQLLKETQEAEIANNLSLMRKELIFQMKLYNCGKKIYLKKQAEQQRLKKSVTASSTSASSEISLTAAIRAASTAHAKIISNTR